MAGTIAIDVTVQADNGVWSFPFSRSFTVSQAGPGSHDPLHYLTTTPEEIGLGELTGGDHVCILFNIGQYSIQWGPKSGGAMVPLGPLAPGQFAVFLLKGGVTLMAKSDYFDGAILLPILFET